MADKKDIETEELNEKELDEVQGGAGRGALGGRTSKNAGRGAPGQSHAGRTRPTSR